MLEIRLLGQFNLRQDGVLIEMPSIFSLIRDPSLSIQLLNSG
jgi:hypothetical protein